MRTDSINPWQPWPPSCSQPRQPGPAWDVGVGAGNTLQYDPSGNMTRFNTGSVTRTYTYTAGTNRFSHSTERLNGYDASGRVTSIEGHAQGYQSFQIDPYWGKATRIAGVQTVAYRFGATGQRVGMTADPDGPTPHRTMYIHGLGAEPLVERRNQGPHPVTRHVYGPAGLLAIHEGPEGTVWFPLKDNLGSTRVMLKTEPAGGGSRTVRPASVTDHLPFGGPMRVYGAGAGRFGFTGQEYDAETDLHNYKARLYSTDTGQFLSPDPAGQFHSPYVGMGNNPVNYVDPDGEWVLLAASYAWKAYRTYQTARAAYQVYQAFDKGGFEAGLGALTQLGTSMIVSNQVGSFQNDLYQPRSLFTSMLSSGVRNAATSSIMSGMYNKGDFAAGFSWKSFGSGMLDAAGGYVDNAYHAGRENNPILYFEENNFDPRNNQYDRDLYRQELRQRLVDYDLNSNIVFKEYSVFNHIASWWNNDEYAIVTLEGPRGVRDFSVRRLGHGELGSNKLRIILKPNIDNVDISHITIHEMGHSIFGFNHSNSKLNIMYPYYQRSIRHEYRFDNSQLQSIKKTPWGR